MSKIPKLRFKEFSGELELKDGNCIFKTITNKKHNSDLPILAITQKHGAIPRDMIDYKISVTKNSVATYKVVEKGDFIISLRSFQGGIEYSKYNGICSPAYIILRATVDIEDLFYKQYLKTTKYIKELNRHIEGIRDGKMVSYKQFSEIKIPFPSKEEQRKIASFLTSVDTKIEQLTKKESLLQDYKKGVMQKIFNQEIRFKADEGSEFGDWEEKKLGDIGKTFNGLTGKTKEDFGMGKPYIQYKQIFDNSSIDINTFGLVNIELNDKQNKAIYGDVFFTTSSETPLEIGFTSVLLNSIEDLYLNSFCFGYRLNSFNIMNPKYSQYLFRSSKFRKEIIKLAQGSTRYNMSKVELMKLSINLPELKEQTKIANFLSTIDKKIELSNIELEKTKEFKKALLQQMFI